MSVSNKKIVTLIPSATEIVAFLGEKKSIIGRSHECDYPKDLNNFIKSSFISKKTESHIPSTF